MKWREYRVTVRMIADGSEYQIAVRALSKSDALWRAVNRSLDARYEAVSAEATS